MAVAVSFWRRAELEQDIALAVLRSFVQLTAVGYVIQAIFDSDSLWLVVALLAVMVGFGACTARGARKARAARVRAAAAGARARGGRDARAGAGAGRLRARRRATWCRSAAW